MPIYSQTHAFNGGEISRRLFSRSDLEKYQLSCAQLENFIALPYGGVTRRPGTEYVATTKLGSTRKSRIISFSFSTTTNFLIEVGHQYLHFYEADKDRVLPSGSAWADSTDYTPGQAVTSGGNTYVALSAHTSDDGGTGGSDDGAGDNEPGIGTDAATYWHQCPTVDDQSRNLASSGGAVVEVPSPWGEDDLDALQYLQIKDVVYFVHPDYSPRKLIRYSDSEWMLSEVVFDVPPILDENVTDGYTITPSANTGTGVTLTASRDTWTADHVGSTWRISYQRDKATQTLELTSGNDNTGTDGQTARGEYIIKTTGNWSGTVHVQQSRDNGTSWETIRSYNSTNDRNIEVTAEVSETSLLRIYYDDYAASSGGTTPRAILELKDAFVHGFAKITAYASATSVTAEWLTDMVSYDDWETSTSYVVGARVSNDNVNYRCILDHTSGASTEPGTGASWETNWESIMATDYWTEGAFSEHQGYPRTVALHEGRIWYASTARQPLGVWGTATDDFENFVRGTNDDDAIYFQISSPRSNQVQWMLSQSESLIIGTSGGEFTMQSRSSDLGITATNVVVREQSSFGSSEVAARIVNDSLIFVTRLKRKLREWSYSFERDGFVGADLTLFAEHLTQSGVTQMEFAQQPHSVLWAITADGDLLGLTYERDQAVAGWHKHTTEGDFESVAVIPGSADDEIWFTIKRTINGQVTRFIERFHPTTLTAAYNGEAEDCLFLDCGLLTVNGSKVSSATGLDHLDGESVGVCTDGATHPDVTISSGSASLQFSAFNIAAGLNMESKLQTLPLVIVGRDGTTRGRKGRIAEARIELYNSLSLEFQGTNGTYQSVPFRKASDNMDEAPPIFTGFKRLPLSGGQDDDLQIMIRQKEPQPCTILSLIQEWQLEETM